MRDRVVNGGLAGALAIMLLAGAGAWGQPASAPAAAGAPATITQRIPGTAVSFELVAVPPGEVAVADAGGGAAKLRVGPLWIGKAEVTWDEYDIFVYRLDLPEDQRAAAQSGDGEGGDNPDAVTRPSKPYLPPDRGYGHSGYPAITMSFHAASEYCRWLSEKTGQKYRLPTEAEWEHAARAGSGELADLGAVAWSAEDAGDTTHPVRKKAPNAWGLHDTLGNVAEWCVGSDGKPVVRGGSFLDPAAEVGVSARKRQTPAWNASDPQIPKSKWWLADCNFVGFRVVREPGPGEAGDPKDKTPGPKAGGGER